MRRLLTAVFSTSLLLQACDRLATGVRNETQQPLTVQLVFRPGADCKTYDPITLPSGKGTATRCLPSDIELVKISQEKKECDVSGADLIAYYKVRRLGSAFPIRAC
jgi:hypothetical protein